MRPVAKVTCFYLLAFGISWLGFVPLILGWHSRAWLLCLVLPGIGPALAAWIAAPETFRSFRIHVPLPWLLMAASIPPILFITENAISRILLPSLEETSRPVRGSALVPLILMALGANIWEEVGWRYCGLRLLQQRFRPWLAATIAGLLWAAWHIPLFLAPLFHMQHYPTGWWALSNVATAIILAWLWNRTNGSIWAVAVFHVATNLGGATLGVRSYTAKALLDAVLAITLLILTRGQLASDKTKGRAEALPFSNAAV